MSTTAATRVHAPTHGHFVYLLVWVRDCGADRPPSKVTYGAYSTQEAAEYEKDSLLKGGVITNPRALHVEAFVIR